MAQRYTIMEDDSGDRYIVPLEKIQEFFEYQAGNRDFVEGSKFIDGPGILTFENPNVHDTEAIKDLDVL